MSANSYPTLNNSLSSVWNIRTHLMSMKSHSDSFIRNISQAMIEKFNKYWEHSSLLHMIACILDPRYKMQFIAYYYREKEKLLLYDFDKKIQDIRIKYEYLLIINIIP